MRALAGVEDLFPENRRGAIVRFWMRYWGFFFLLLPWMLLRQVGVSLQQAAGVLFTWNREVVLLDGALRVVFMNNLSSLLLTAIFGERFTTIQYEDVLIDPGPAFGRRRLRRFLEERAGCIAVVVATHAHEEHVGNAALAASLLGTPVLGTAVTLEALRQPERISLPRRTFIGQPEAADPSGLRRLDAELVTPRVRLQVIESPGHCDGHASLFDAERGLLFAGDSFLHTIFTAPNREVSGDDWITTLEAYCALDIRTMVGTHGLIHSRDPSLPERRFLVKRRDPRLLIEEKLRFLRWARDVVAEGERRQLPYSVIEACLFPWQRWWAWHTWFTDEGGRLFSAGEFSRTHFVRSLSRIPEQVPARFPPFVRLLDRLGALFARGGARRGPKG